MKLQKQVSNSSADKKFYKYVMVLPSKTVKELGWSEGQDLLYNVTAKNLLLIGPSSKLK